MVEPTNPTGLPAQVCSAIETLRTEASQPLDGVALTVPGLVDRDGGTVREFDTPDGTTIDELDLRSPVSAEFGLECYLENDCNASVLGEWFYGARDAESSVAHVTIGTGIGGGVVEDGRLLAGESGQAGEFGLVPVDPESDLASLGVPGAWEAYCSGRGIPRFVRYRLDTGDAEPTPAPGDGPDIEALARSGDLGAQDVYDAAEAGDPFATDCLEQLDRYNAAGIAAICNSFNPGLITVGGGVALNNSERLLSGIEAHLGTYCFVDHPELEVTSLGDDIGLYGALATFVQRSDRADATVAARSSAGVTD